MKTKIHHVSLVVCGVRPARIDFDHETEHFIVTSPACELSTLYPNAVSEVRYSLVSAIELCKCLLVPVFDDDINNPTLGSVPRIQVVDIQLLVMNDDDERVFAYMHIYFSPACDLSKVETSYDNVRSVCVSVPEINVIEYFEKFKSAYDFCLYLSTPSVSCIPL